MLAVERRAGQGGDRRPGERASPLHTHQRSGRAAHRLDTGARPGAHDVQRRRRRSSTRSIEAGRCSALGRRARAGECRAGGGAPKPGRDQSAHAGRGRGAANQGGRPPRATPRSPRRSTARRRSRRAIGRVRHRPAMPIVTLINPDDLWVRADVEETYIDRIRLGDQLTVRLPSGVERQGRVILRGVDASFATQRDVSRTKRDIKTFEVRLARGQRRPAPRGRHDRVRAAAICDDDRHRRQPDRQEVRRLHGRQRHQLRGRRR